MFDGTFSFLYGINHAINSSIMDTAEAMLLFLGIFILAVIAKATKNTFILIAALAVIWIFPSWVHYMLDAATIKLVASGIIPQFNFSSMLATGWWQ